MQDEITIRMDDLSQAVSASVETMLGTSPAIYLSNLFQQSTMQSYMALVQEIAW